MWQSCSLAAILKTYLARSIFKSLNWILVYGISLLKCWALDSSQDLNLERKYSICSLVDCDWLRCRLINWFSLEWAKCNGFLVAQSSMSDHLAQCRVSCDMNNNQCNSLSAWFLDSKCHHIWDCARARVQAFAVVEHELVVSSHGVKFWNKNTVMACNSSFKGLYW